MESEEITFEDLGLDEETLKAVARKGFQTPSPIQVLSIPRLLNGDTNLIARARTGTGKTAAFGLPIVQRLRDKSDHIRALILEPTRELAVQTCNEMESFASGHHPKTIVVYGGASMNTQMRDLKRGPDIVVGTPGRVQDHIERGTLDVSKIDYFILDEGDEMLDMGFIEDIENIFDHANPDSRILLFSATVPPPILKIAKKFMGEYEIVEEGEVTEEPLPIDQQYWVVRESEKIEALVRLIDMSPDFFGLVFTQTKVDADLVSQQLDRRGYEVAALHGDIAQAQREKILSRFRIKKTRILVATDVAARGIDITGLSHVINYSLPFDSWTYIHRIGRTGRAGAAGCAVTFVRPDERRKLTYMQAAVRKASKGEMVAGKIPSIDTVLEIKRKRMFTDMKKALGLLSEDSGNTATLPEDAEDSGAEGEAATEKSESHLIQIQPIFEKMATELCATEDAQDVLAAVLSLMYGKALDKSHYGEISSANGSAAAKGNQIRLYVQLGRRDGYNARALADYFSNMLNIPGRMVDRIDISENFSLVSLPAAAGNRALDLSRSGEHMPHMHVDTKGEEGSRFRGDRERQRGRFAVARGNKDKRGYFRDRERFGGKPDGFRGSHVRRNVHVPTERSAGGGFFRKRSRDSETF